MLGQEKQEIVLAALLLDEDYREGLVLVINAWDRKLGYDLKRFPIVAVRRIFTRCGHESQLALNEWGVGTADETAAAHRNM